jgi:ABC-type transport system substrate-binding protein
MSKVDTLLKLIAYQKQHPQASYEEIAQGIGMSSRHVRRCQKEVNLLKHQLDEPALQPGQIQFILSLLNRHEPDQKEIAQQLQKQMGVSYTGTLRLKEPNEQTPVSWLEIGELSSTIEMGSLERPDRMLSYWLQFLCYDPLLMYYRNGETEGRLAIGCEAVNGNSQWQLTLRKDLRWSDGKPITLEEISAAFAESRIAPIITEIKPDGKTQLRVQLSQEEPLFPFHLRGICPLPSHSSQPYRVTSGPYQVKHFRPDAMTLRFEQNPDYYRGGDSSINGLTLRRFTHPANAIKAVENGTLDLLAIHLHSMQSIYQFPTTVPFQQWPFFGDSYYALFLNRHHGLLSDERNCRILKEAIDYRAINLYLRMGQVAEEENLSPLPHSPLDIRIYSSGGVFRYLAYLIGKSAGSSVVNPISVKGEMREEADAFLTQPLFGLVYDNLSRFFHSDGEDNFFGYSNPQVDEMLSQLNGMANPGARRRIGQQVLSLVQEDFAVILLAPDFHYSLSPLEIQFDDNFTDLIDLVQNMSQLTVERHRSG